MESIIEQNKNKNFFHYIAIVREGDVALLGLYIRFR